MDIISDMPFVFLGSRLKRLAEHMQADSSLLASDTGTYVPPGLYPVLALLKEETSMTVGELARAIRVSQPAITKSIQKLSEEGLVESCADNSDKRKSVAVLTSAGRSIVARGEKIVWPLLDAVVRELTDGLSGSFLDQLEELEKRLAAEPLPERASRLSLPQLLPASAEDLSEVVLLLNRSYRCIGSNGGWTTEMGIIDGDRISIETLTQEVTSKPDATLLVWKQQNEVKGCVWLEPVGDGIWYLGSLAIEPLLQNVQHGRKLLAAAEQWCLSRGGSKIQMTVLDVRETLIKWYERRGYCRTGETEPFPSSDTRFGTPVGPGLHFIFMEKSL